MRQLISIAGLLAILDVIITWLVVRRAGPAAEGNPIHRFVMVRWGNAWGLVGIAVGYFLLITLGVVLGGAVLTGLAVGIAITVANNAAIIWRKRDRLFGKP